MTSFLTSILLTLHLGLAHDHCGDLYEYACKKENQGKYDGTGHNLTQKQLKKVLSKKEKRERAQFEKGFDQIFQNSKALQKRVNFACRKSTNKDKCKEAKAKVIKDYLFKGYISIVDPVSPIKAPPALISEFQDYDFIRNVKIRKLVDKARRRVDDHDTAKLEKLLKDKLFDDIKTSLKRTFSKLPDSPKKDKMLDAIEKTQLHIKRCDRDELLFHQGFYNKITNSVRICHIDLLRNPSLFTLSTIIAHEVSHGVAHAIKIEDREYKELEPLVSCLTSEKSLNAQTRGKSFLSFKRDQINEGFCDWAAAETLADLATQKNSLFSNLTEVQFGRGVANAHPHCEIREDLDDSAIKFYNYYKSHPLIWNRINLIGTHPKIREKMGCKNPGPQVYCPLQGPAEPQEGDETVDTVS